MRIDPLTAWDDPVVADGCAYIVTNGRDSPCGESCLPGSSYCLVHHELTHLRRGSEAEAIQIRAINAAGVAAIWGKQVLVPTEAELRRLEALVT